MSNIDILAFGAHPDDVELAAAGTLLRHKSMGYSIGIVDLTQGELGTRGTSSTRRIESAKSAEILGLSVRENLMLADGFFGPTQENMVKLIEVIRKYKPSIVLANAINDRHPDHAKGAAMVAEACFLSGLSKIKTSLEDIPQEAHRPAKVFHYIQDYHLQPDFVVGIDAEMNLKMESIKAYSTQFYSEEESSEEPSTPISSKTFYDFLIGRARDFGRIAGCEFGEGFNYAQPLAINSLFDLK